jgi:hypothetical protein
MNNNGINLLVDKRSVKSLAPIKDRLKIFRFSAIGILFCVGASAVILSILIVFSPLEQLRKDEERAVSDLKPYKLDISKLAFINERGDSIRKLLAKRTSYDKKLSVVENKIPTDVSLDALTIAKKNYTLKFSSKNLSSLDGLLNGLVSITGSGKDFFRIYLTSVTADEANHRFILIVDLLTT